MSVCTRCGKKWESTKKLAYCRFCKSPYWDKPISRPRTSAASRRKPALDEESDASIEHRCVMEYGVDFINNLKSKCPGWRQWTWKQREEALCSEKARMEDLR